MNDKFNQYGSGNQFNDTRGAEHPIHRRELEQLISLYQDGEASPAEQLKVVQYLESCAGCRQIFDSYLQLEGQLRDYIESIPQPLWLQTTGRFKEKLRQEEAALLPENIHHTPRRAGGFAARPGRLAGLAGVAMALVVMFGIVALVLINIPNNPAPTVSVSGTIAETPETTTVVPSPTPTTLITTIVPVTTTQAPLPTVEITNGVVTAQVTAAQETPTAKLPTTVVSTRAATTVATTTSAAALNPATTSVAITTTPAATTVFTPVPTTVATTAAPTSVPTTVAVATATPSPTAPTATPLTVLTSGWISFIGKEDGEIYLVRSDGTNRTRLTRQTSENKMQWRQLVWSNDAKWIAGVAYHSDIRKFKIYIFNVEGTPKPATTLNFVAEGASPVWSPTSFWMSYLAGPVRDNEGALSGQPAVIELKKRRTVILSKEASGLTPQWFDDEVRLLVDQNKIMDVDGNEISTLNIFDNTCAAASLSPKNNKLVVLETDGGGFRPVLYDLNNNNMSGRIKPSLRSKNIFYGVLGRGYDCGAYRINWNRDGSGYYFFMNEGSAPGTCWVGLSDYAQCLKNVYEPGFTDDASYYVDFNPNTGYVYSAIFGNRPNVPRIIGETKFPVAWQPKP